MGMWYTAAPLEVIAYSRPGTASTSAGREVKVRPLAMTMWMPRPMARSRALRFPSESLLSPFSVVRSISSAMHAIAIGQPSS